MRTGREILALARLFDVFGGYRLFTEVYIDGGLADVVLVSKSGYAYEIEIKCSVNDFNKDAKKHKWKKPRNQVKCFFYAVPAEIADRVEVPEHAGLIVLHDDRSGAMVKQMAPANKDARKLSPATILRWYENWHHRTWHWQFELLRREEEEERKKAWAEHTKSSDSPTSS